MKKKFAIVNVHGPFGDNVQILGKEEYGLCMCKTTILFETDDFKEVCEEFHKNYDK